MLEEHSNSLFDNMILQEPKFGEQDWPSYGSLRDIEITPQAYSYLETAKHENSFTGLPFDL